MINLRTLLAGCGLLAAATATHAAAPEGVLRFCADPDNPPFTQEKGDDRGAYVEVAELIGKQLQMKTQYTWWRSMYGKRSVRNTLLADSCDAYLGLPNDRSFLGKQVALSRPFTSVGQVVVLPKGSAFSSLDDLKGKRVAVQFRSHPQLIMATLPGFQWVTFREAEEALDAMKRGDADAAFVWGPSAGAHNKHRLGDAFQVVSVSGEGMQWQVVIGVRPSETALLQRLNGAIEALEGDIRAVMERYGFPRGNAVPINVKLLSMSPPQPTVATPQTAAVSGTSDMTATSDPGRVIKRAVTLVQAKPAEAAKGAANPEAIAAGKSEFNQHCSHCHAPNAMSPEQSRDLRRLRIRYGDKMRETAYSTISGGRNDKGMPSWKGVIGDDKIQQILVFLESVQRQP